MFLPGINFVFSSKQPYKIGLYVDILIEINILCVIMFERYEFLQPMKCILVSKIVAIAEPLKALRN